MASYVFALCVLTALGGCLQAHEISEQALYASETWNSDAPAVLVRAQEDVHVLEEWLDGTDIPTTEVNCDVSSDSDLCTLLTSHSVVVRREGRVLEGVAGETGDNNTVAAVMEKLFGPEFHLIADYVSMKEFQDSHPQHMLAYARSSEGTEAFKDYLFFLKALLTQPERSTHIAVTKQSLALPLTRRPKYSKSEKLYLWLVSDSKWCQYGNSSHPYHIVGGIASFYKRMSVPFKLKYASEELTTEYRDMGLFTSYVIHSPGKKSLAERVVDQFIEQYCNFFIFLIVEKSTRKHKLTKALYLNSGDNNIIVIEPPLLDMPPIHLNLEGIEEQDMVTMLAPIQEEFMERYMIDPETGRPAKRRRTVVTTDPTTVGFLAVDSNEDMLVAFCDDNDDQVCGHFEHALQQVADIISTSIYQRQELGFVVVRSQSLEDVKKYGVDDYPYIAYYNVSSEQWAEVRENKFQEIINRALGQPEESPEEKAEKKEMEKEWDEEQKKFLKGNKPDKKLLKEAEKISREYVDPKPPPTDTPPEHQPPSPPLASSPPPVDSLTADDSEAIGDSTAHQSLDIIAEDDHFGQLSFSLGPPDYPDELVLTEDTFGMHINRYLTTMVTFYVPWEPHCDGVMHYMLQALEDLPEDSSSSLAVVNCADYTDLCRDYDIVHYPTVLLFRASPDDWVLYTGMMDSRQILRSLEDRPEKRDGLLELTPDTLPLLVTKGTLSQTVLVVWVEEYVGGGGGGGREEKSGPLTAIERLADVNEYGNFSFAWMNCKTHEKLLLKVFQEFDCHSLLLFDFQQRSVYKLPPSEWLSRESLAVAAQDFLSQYMAGSLTASGQMIDWSWPPLQPPIKFPSVKRQRGGTDQQETPTPSSDATPSSSSPPTPPPSPPPPSITPSANAHHVHTEL